MSKASQRLLIFMIPLLLFGAVWGINWRRLHPAPSALDALVRGRLLSADRVDVEVETVEPSIGGATRFVTRLPPTATRSVVSYLDLTREQPHDWGTGYVPVVYLEFYRGGKALGSLCSSYSVYGFNYFLDSPSHPIIRRGLHPTSLQRLRELISQHPEIIRALVEAGAQRQYLDPSAFTRNVP